MAPDEKVDKPVSGWQLFFDDVFLLFFLSAAIMFISYTVWGLIEISSVQYSTLVGK
ncbi:MAG: hypothetical protein HZB29_02190 [Nitrospinae bacterium]|nr:hypothetical protein [Nitrospinota bacterium]